MGLQKEAVISVVTINYNNGKGLNSTINSLIKQTVAEYEHIIIDGGSTDESVDVIKKHSNKIAYWVSERDNGVYNAMNKGIEKASKNYLLFLNSGDILKDELVMEELISVVAKNNEAEIIYGDVEYRNSSGVGQTYKFPETLTIEYFLEHSIPHPSTLIKKTLFFEYGLYDESLKIVADWAFFLKVIIINSVKYKHIDRTVSVFNTEGISSQADNERLVEEERLLVIQKSFHGSILDLLNKKKHFEHYYNKYKIGKLNKLLEKMKRLLG